MCITTAICDKKKKLHFFFVNQQQLIILCHLLSVVISFFSPFSVDDECLSDDGRRTGVCMNVYECRLQGMVIRNS